VWIGHTAPYQQLTDINEQVVRVARSAGFVKRMIETVPDRNGRPVYEVFRFVPAGAAAASEVSR
jgi:hypothetical protein